MNKGVLKTGMMNMFWTSIYYSLTRKKYLKGVVFLIFLFPTFAKDLNNCVAIVNQIGSNTRTITRIIQRYWGHPDIEPLVYSIRNLRNISIFSPFHIHASISELENTLIVRVHTLGSSQFRMFDYGSSKRYDSTLPKVIAGILIGTLERKDANPQLHTLEIQVDKVMNNNLLEILKSYGFQAINGNSKNESLKLSINLNFDLNEETVI